MQGFGGQLVLYTEGVGKSASKTDFRKSKIV